MFWRMRIGISFVIRRPIASLMALVKDRNTRQKHVRRADARAVTPFYKAACSHSWVRVGSSSDANDIRAAPKAFLSSPVQAGCSSTPIGALSRSLQRWSRWRLVVARITGPVR